MKYQIVEMIGLGFLTHNDSYDVLTDAGWLEFNGSDIVYTCPKGTTRVSHTSNNAINIWVQQGKINPIEG